MAQSQPSFFANNSLPPLSPFPPSESSIISSNSNLKDVPMDEIDVSSRGPSIMPHPFPFRASDNLPPRKGHRRSNSDVPSGFSSENNKPVELKMREMDKVNYVKSEGEVVDDLVNSLMNFDHADGSNSRCGEGGNVKSELVSGLREEMKRSGCGDIVVPLGRHYRSLSMDSAMGRFCLGDEPPSDYEKSGKVNSEFGRGEFSDVELKKIMADVRLAEIAMSDPKRAKRILANRQSAARSKERKMRYISELEHKVQILQKEATTLSAQVTILQKECAELTSRNNELKFRVQAMEQQAHIRDALHDALTSEIQHLKLREERRTSNGILAQQQVTTKRHVFSMQSNQMQRTSANSDTISAASTSA